MKNEIKKFIEEIDVMSGNVQYIKLYGSLRPSRLYSMYYPSPSCK